jgi:hypothetical protein
MIRASQDRSEQIAPCGLDALRMCIVEVNKGAGVSDSHAPSRGAALERSWKFYLDGAPLAVRMRHRKASYHRTITRSPAAAGRLARNRPFVAAT